MLQLVAGLTVVFAGYVLYEVFKTVSQTANRPPLAGPTHDAAKLPGEIKAAAEAPAQPGAVPSAVEPSATASVEPAVAETKADAEPAMAQEAPVTAAAPERSPEKPAALLRNPATGETSAVPTNYRFAKKWIKEALVAEGFLDRIYKVAELDEQASQTVKLAIERLKSLEKYQA